MVKGNEKTPAPGVPRRNASKGLADADKGAAEMTEMAVVEPNEKGAGLHPKLQAHLGRQLRAMYDEVAQEPIPDKLLQLLRQLDKGGSD